MATGAVLTHGVSGFPTTGIPGDFEEQRRSEPFRNASDPIVSYMNAQNHIGIPMSNFNEPWSGGMLQDINFSAQPYRTPFVGPLDAPPGPRKAYNVLAPVDYPSQLGATGAQQLPLAPIHNNVQLPVTYRQNLVWENGMVNGDNKLFLPQTPIFLDTNTHEFQGSVVPAGVHPNNDKLGSQTVPNTQRVDFKGGQAPFTKLPNGITISEQQPTDTPQLYEMPPPPDPQVLPGEGTAPLLPTVPRWW